jgi:geranylgeranyl diphosphate synthase type I
MNLKELFADYLPQIEAEMRDCLSASDPALVGYYGMMNYHLGWADERFAPARVSSGKRIRPMLCLLACQSAGGDALRAIPAAAAVELLHNFSLIHDDIEDNSPTRRGRPSVWALWGVPQAINSGDGMYSIAHMTLGRLSRQGVPAERVLAVRAAFDHACMALTHGQYLDLSFESRERVSVDEYMAMVDVRRERCCGALRGVWA